MFENAFENLKQNLISIFVVAGLLVIMYCKWKGVTLGELIRELREAMSDND